MKIKFFIAVMIAFFTVQVLAAHGSYSVMAPRAVSSQMLKRDFSFGLSVLPGNAIDGLEPAMRRSWYLNYEILDQYILRPVAHGYASLPQGVQDGVGNFLDNLDEVPALMDNLLLLQATDALRNLGRFTINSTLGLLGIFDIASMLGIEQRPMDMNTVLGRYGVDQGEYLMLPMFGPSTSRSLHAGQIDAWPYYLVAPWINYAVDIVAAIHTRAGLIAQENLLDNSVDSYAQMRQLYLMYQQGKVDPQAAASVDEQVDAQYLDEIDSM